MSRARLVLMRRPAGSPGRAPCADSAGKPGSGSILRRSRVTCTSIARSLTPPPTLLHSVSRLSTSPRRRAERAQQRDLGVGQRHALALLRELAQLEVELQRAEARRARGARRRFGRPAAAQHALDAQQQLARLERLGEIVVDALLEAGDAVLGIAHGGQHQDRHVVGACAARRRSRGRSGPAS